mmetsp:Transcript_57671/g.187373  ORF Transcript_57671/g.187373 Transcript_57671/m.187373 type:complete len:351 (-) Transcript_57671:18-1070(-)
MSTPSTLAANPGGGRPPLARTAASCSAAGSSENSMRLNGNSKPSPLAFTNASLQHQCLWKAPYAGSSSGSTAPPLNLGSPPPASEEAAATCDGPRRSSAFTKAHSEGVSWSSKSRKTSRAAPAPGRTSCGAATSAPQTQSGSLARMTQSPSWDTLKLKFAKSARSGPGRGALRNGFLPLVRAISKSLKLLKPKTMVEACRTNKREIRARFLSTNLTNFKTCSRSSFSRMRPSKNRNSTPWCSSAGCHCAEFMAQRRRPLLAEPSPPVAATFLTPSASAISVTAAATNRRLAQRCGQPLPLLPPPHKLFQHSAAGRRPAASAEPARAGPQAVASVRRGRSVGARGADAEHD